MTHLVEAGAGEGDAQAGLDGVLARLGRQLGGAAGHRRRHLVEAAHARDLLDAVRLALDVQPPRGHLDLGRLALPGELEAQRPEDLLGRLLGDRRAQQLAHARKAQLEAARPGQLAVHVHPAPRHAGAAQLGEQLGGAVLREGDHRGIDAALEAVRRLGVQCVPTGSATDAAGLEGRALEEDAASSSALISLVAAAHDARERRRRLARRR